MRKYKKRLLIALAGAAMALNVQISAHASAQTVLGPEVTNYITSRSDNVSVGVYDANTGKTYTYDPSLINETVNRQV